MLWTSIYHGQIISQEIKKVTVYLKMNLQKPPLHLQ